MACRIGISKYPHTRMQEWKDAEGHTYGKVLAENLTYDQAHKREREEATARSCHYAPGGDPGDDRNRKVWAVYYVSGGTIR